MLVEPRTISKVERFGQELASVLTFGNDPRPMSWSLPLRELGPRLLAVEQVMISKLVCYAQPTAQA